MSERYRCCITGCNPKLIGETAATEHRTKTGHRTAKWPVRSEAGKAKAQARNQSGYYSKYNGGHRPRERHWGERDPYDDDHPFSPEALGQD